MGGDSTYPTIIGPQERSHLEKAKQLTAEQIDIAKSLHADKFAGDNTPGLVLAILNAVAQNYAATVNKFR
jgi:hypothetical protein